MTLQAKQGEISVVLKHALCAHQKYEIITILMVLRIREVVRLAQTRERRGYEGSIRICAECECQRPLTCWVTLATSSHCPELVHFPIDQRNPPSQVL